MSSPPSRAVVLGPIGDASQLVEAALHARTAAAQDQQFATTKTLFFALSSLSGALTRDLRLRELGQVMGLKGRGERSERCFMCSCVHEAVVRSFAPALLRQGGTRCLLVHVFSRRGQLFAGSLITDHAHARAPLELEGRAMASSVYCKSSRLLPAVSRMCRCSFVVFCGSMLEHGHNARLVGSRRRHRGSYKSYGEM